MLDGIITRIGNLRREVRAASTFAKYRNFSMLHPAIGAANLSLCLKKAPATGCIVECGVWRGGMSGAMADIMPGRRHFLFDSFEGLPPAQAEDGQKAVEYQLDHSAPNYFDNCKAERQFAEKAMAMSAAESAELIQGWFKDTVPGFQAPEPIAVLRLDGDWYESTMTCLTHLYPQVMDKGLVIIDDYYHWEGCTRAVHDYLSQNKVADRIREYGGVAFIEKGIAA